MQATPVQLYSAAAVKPPGVTTVTLQCAEGQRRGVNTPGSAETLQILNTEQAGTSYSHALQVGDEVMSAGCWSVKEEETRQL